MKKLILAAVPDALMVAGAAAISAGAWMIYAPAGPVLAGIFMLSGGLLLARSAGK